MQLGLNALQVHTIYAGRNAEAVHEPIKILQQQHYNIITELLINWL